MNTPRHRETVNPQQAAGFLERTVLACILGLLSGCCFAAFDVLRHAPGLAPRDVLVAMTLGGIPGVLVSLGLFVLLSVAVMCIRLRMDRRRWVALFAGLHVTCLAAAIVLVATTNHRDWTGLLVWMASLPVAVMVIGLLARVDSAGLRWRAVVWTLAAIFGLLVALCGSAAVRAWEMPWVMRIAPWLAALLVLGVSLSRSRRTPMRVGVPLALGLPIGVALFASYGEPAIELPAFRPGQRAANSRPNVVLIVLDTTRRDYLGCYGHPGGLTPELDRIAAEGVVYEDAFSAAPWTVPSHASMFTGLYPTSHGCSYERHLWLDDEFVTLAEMLRDEGYQTLALNSNLYLPNCNLLQGFDTMVQLPGRYGSGLALQPLAAVAGAPARWMDWGAAAAPIQFTKWLAEVRLSDRPFFLFINLFEAHSPYLPPYSERASYLPQDVDYLAATAFARDFEPYVNQIRRTRDPETARLVQSLYRGEVRYQDKCLGDILALLRAHADLDNTLLIITADHGDNLGEQGRWDHVHAINDALIHVPLIIRYPPRFPGGIRLSGLCQTVDLIRTVNGVLRPDPHDRSRSGRSLIPSEFTPRAFVVAQTGPFVIQLPKVEEYLGFQVNMADFNISRHTLRTDLFKFVVLSNGRLYLHDLAIDPTEQVNLLDAQPDLATAFVDRLEQWTAAQPDYVPSTRPAQTRPLSPTEIQRLKALGYVQ